MKVAYRVNAVSRPNFSSGFNNKPYQLAPQHMLIKSSYDVCGKNATFCPYLEKRHNLINAKNFTACLQRKTGKTFV